jgi:predicted SnoaL-like aldol condensation-catalyzing enzyme
MKALMQPNFAACGLLLAGLILAAAPASAHRERDTENANKQLVSRFVGAVLGNVDPDVVARQVAPNLIQHDPLVHNGRAGTAAWIRAMRQQSPAQTMTVKHLLADGDMVFVHAHLASQPGNEMSGTNRYDFYRVDGGTIVEHWSYQGPAPTWSQSGNSEFSNLYVYAGPQPPVPAARVDLNRELVKALSDEVFGKRNFGMLDRFWSVGYLQHNPYVASGRAGLASVIQYIATPANRYRLVHGMADGDLAVVCAQVTDITVDEKNEFAGAAVCDMYRVANLELVEHWDVGQPVPTSSLSGNSMFSKLYREHGQH